MGEIGKALKEWGFIGPVGRQVVLTGGGAELKGIADYAQRALGRAVRIGRPRGLTGLPEPHSGPAFATLAGLALYGDSNPVALRWLPSSKQTTPNAPGSAFVQRLIPPFRTNYY